MLFVGGPIDGERRLGHTDGRDVRIFTERAPGTMGRDPEEHIYRPMILAADPVKWQIYLHHTMNPSDALQFLLDGYGTDAQPPMEEILRKSPISQWEERSAFSARGDPSYRLYVWDPHDSRQVWTASEFGDNQGFQRLSRILEDHIASGREAWITNSAGTPLAGAICSYCGSRETLFVVRRDGSPQPDFRCVQHIPLPGEFLGSCTRLRPASLAEIRANRQE